MNKCKHPSPRIYWKAKKQIAVFLCNKELWQSSRIYLDWYLQWGGHTVFTKKIVYFAHWKIYFSKLVSLNLSQISVFWGSVCVCVCVCTVWSIKYSEHLALSNLAHKVTLCRLWVLWYSFALSLILYLSFEVQFAFSYLLLLFF